MTEQVHRIDPSSFEEDGPDSELLTVTNARLEQYGVDFVTDRIDPALLHEKPTYSIGECAKFFFGRTVYWIRFQEQQDAKFFSDRPDKPDRPSFVLDGERLQFPTTKHGMRVYTLDLIERMAHALAQNDRITGAMLNNVLTLVETEARLYGYL